MSILRKIPWPSRIFFNRPLFVRENRIAFRRWYLWLSLFLFLWLPMTIGIRHFLMDEALGNLSVITANFFRYISLTLRPDMVIAIFMSWKIAKTFTDKNELETLALTGLSPSEIILSILAPKILILVIFQMAGGPLSYYDMLSSPEHFVTINTDKFGLGNLFGDELLFNTAYIIILFAVIEDMLYASLCIVMFTALFLKIRSAAISISLGVFLTAILMLAVFLSDLLTHVIYTYIFPDLLWFFYNNFAYWILFSNGMFFITMLPVEIIAVLILFFKILKSVKALYPPYD